MKQLLSLIFLCSYFLTFAQNELKIGQWEAHLPYVKGTSVTQSEDRVFYGTDQSLIIFEKSDRSFRRISKTDGLSGVGITNVKYHPQQQTLVVIYTDGTIDFVHDDGEINTLFFIRDFTNIVGEKVIYDIHISGEETFLLATNYGISMVNIPNQEFEFTTFTNDLNVFGITQYNNSLYAATEEGIYQSAENNPFIEAFGEWAFLGPEENFPDDYTSYAIETFDNRLFFGTDSLIYEYSIGETPNLLYTNSNQNLITRYLSAEGNNLLAGFADPTVSSPGQSIKIASDNTVTPLTTCARRPLDAVESSNGDIWLADNFDSYHLLAGGEVCTNITPNSPPSVRNNNLEVYNSELWVTSGGISLNTSPLGFSEGFYSFIEGSWERFNQFNYDTLAGMTDFVPLVIHPETGVVFAGSYFDGLAKWDRETMFLINDANSSMTNAVGAGNARTRVSGLAFDSENNLWVTNHLGERPISVMRNDGSWENFACSNATSVIGLTIDDFDFKWIGVAEQNSGFLVFDEVENRCKTYTSGNSELTTNTVNCITKDLDGEMWVGTQEGIVIFECGDPFSDDCRGSRRIVEVDGIAANLLKDENVRSITVDGANRKWVGTSNGVFLLSADGRENLLYLSQDNSPLFDNVINDIAIDGSDGKVYIGTDKGIQAFRGEAVDGRPRNAPEPNVFPNPVRPDYNGPIAIKGLATDADIKITDVNGQLIYQTTALGGQAIWDGRDYNGRRAASGVYLVFSTRTSNLNQNDAVIAKILVMN